MLCNLFKALSAALSISKADHPQKNIVLSERTNFPTDLYIAEALCKERGYQLKLVEAEELHSALQHDVAVLMLTHVNYRTGAMLNMKDMTAADLDAAVRTIAGSARSMGVTVEGV